VGTSVDLLGANFTDATSVKFNGTNAAYTIDSDSEIHATVPSGATSGPISVTTPSGTGTSNDSFTVTVPPPTISLTARGYKVKGLEKADLSWSGPSGASFDLYRSGTKIATVQTTAYTDNINTKGPGSYTYKVCEAGATTCSNDATVSF